MRALLWVSLCPGPGLHIKVEAVAGENEAGILRPCCPSRVLEQVSARQASDNRPCEVSALPDGSGCRPLSCAEGHMQKSSHLYHLAIARIGAKDEGHSAPS
jgi:hypothetical protein